MTLQLASEGDLRPTPPEERKGKPEYGSPFACPPADPGPTRAGKRGQNAFVPLSWLQHLDLGEVLRPQLIYLCI